MARTRLSKAKFVEYGYGQVEPNHLSAQRTGQIYAQLPATNGLSLLENGQFVKYDYANNRVNLTGPGEWMLVFNEVKVYRDHEADCDFAMKKEDYVARVYSPMGEITGEANARNYKDVVNAYEHDITSTTNPFVIEQRDDLTLMPEGTVMVPRVFKTNVGDIFTTNTIEDGEPITAANVTDGVFFMVNPATGYLKRAEKQAAIESGMAWQAVKAYTMPDRQRAVKIMRIA